MTDPTAPLIALVEDEEHLAQGLLFNLQAEGYRTHHEADGDAALSYLLSDKEKPSAVILDCMLPGADGFTIVRALREARHYTPILMLTARSRPEEVLEGIEAGADDYLAKPFDLSILLVRLKSLLRRTAWQNAATAETPPPVLADQTDDLTPVDGEIDFVQGDDARIGLRNPPQLEDRPICLHAKVVQGRSRQAFLRPD